ncbi:MAG TPA: STAS domain-containing protein [Solirubrobacteraceae bacterium]|jgi:anti-anti-sigma factor
MSVVGRLLQVAVEQTGSTIRIAARGEVDISTVEGLRETIGMQLGGDGEIVVVDLSDVTFIDSSGLHALLDAASQAPERLRVIPGAAALTLFMISGTAGRLPLVDNLGRDGLRPHPEGNLHARESRNAH